MKYLESKEAFENAVRNGLENPEDYMYMYWPSVVFLRETDHLDLYVNKINKIGCL